MTDTRSLSGLLLVAALCLGASRAEAHDFWLQPESFSPAPRAAVSFSLEVGHGPDRRRSPIGLRRIVRFEAFAPDGARRNLLGAFRDADSSPVASATFETPGVYALVLATDNNAQSRLPAGRYNEYARAEGLTLALAQRQRSGRTRADGSEIYSRCAKTFLRVGAAPLQQSAIGRRYGLALEIVPERLPEGAGALAARIYFRDRPLSGATVKLTDLEHDQQPLQVMLTDRNGRARFTIPRSGAWLLNVVWSAPLPRRAPAEFETTFSSLAFAT